MTLPTFIGIGPGKTGTTWLYQCLKEHPEITLARGTKETLFFNYNYHLGLPWYERFFEGANTKAIGEVSNDYFFSDESPARIASTVPHVKLVTLLRNPIDRLFSVYHFNTRNGNFRPWGHDDSVSLEEVLATVPTMLEMNRYRRYLENYLKVFPREQIFIGLYDDLKANPQSLSRGIYEFIGVDPGFQPPSLDTRVLAASQARFGKNLYYAKRVGSALREYGLHPVLTWAKTNPLVLKMLTRPVRERTRMSEETRVSLRNLFAPDIEFVEKLVDRDLSHWR